MCEKYFDYLFLPSDLNFGLPDKGLPTKALEGDERVTCKQFEP